MNSYRRTEAGRQGSHVFNGFEMINAHRQARASLENYVHGFSDSHELRDEVCQPDCLFGQWLHSDAPKQPELLPLFDVLCQFCESFHETLNQAVLLKQMGQEESAKSLLSEGSMYQYSSSRLEHNILTLHDILKNREQR